MKVFKVNGHARIPEFATEDSSCFDLRACLSEDQGITAYNPHNKKLALPVRRDGLGVLYFQLPAQFRALVPSGLIFSIPKNHELKVYPRSGMALKNGITLANCTAVIDNDYVEETFIMLYNISDTPMIIKNDDRVAQARIAKLPPKYKLEETNKRPAKRTSRDGGLGSTGVQ